MTFNEAMVKLYEVESTIRILAAVIILLVRIIKYNLLNLIVEEGPENGL